MIAWLKRLWAKIRPKPIYVYKPEDDRLDACISWIENRPKGRHYVACRLMSTVRTLQARFPGATVQSIPRMMTGWATYDTNAYLCCTSTLRSPVFYEQLSTRLRASNGKDHTLLFVSKG